MSNYRREIKEVINDKMKSELVFVEQKAVFLSSKIE